MDFSQFSIQLLLIFFPGVLCAYIVDTFTSHRPWQQFQFVIYAFLLGVMSYCWYAALVHLLPWAQAGDIIAIKLLSTKVPEISPGQFVEVAYVTAIAVLLGITLAWVSRYKYHFRLLRYMGITHKFGEVDVWEHFFNSPGMEWVTVIDLANNLMYQGWAVRFSDNFVTAEILLEDVEVYDEKSGKFLYNADVQYLSLARDNISVQRNKPATTQTGET